VHCDVKLANILVEVHTNGQHRGILADFDLSKDLEHRLQEVATSVMSVPGARGTLGCLTMAPEVLRQGRQPDFKADIYSFGGIVLQTLFKSQADVWERGGDDTRWDSVSDAPVLAMVKNDMARDLLSKVLHRRKDERPTSTQVVSHIFFSADRQALDLLQVLEQGREELERKHALHSDHVHKYQQSMEDEKQSMALAKDEIKMEFNRRQAQLELERTELQRKSEELKGLDMLNVDVQKQLNSEAKLMDAESKKMSVEKKKREQVLQKQQEAHAQKMRDSEARLLERKKIEVWKKE
jgi:serine/threonine protein kinase